jgi:hypothetical protein
VGSSAERRQLRPHPPASGEVHVRALDAHSGSDEELWAAVIEVMLGGSSEPLAGGEQCDFCERRVARAGQASHAERRDRSTEAA